MSIPLHHQQHGYTNSPSLPSSCPPLTMENLVTALSYLSGSSLNSSNSHFSSSNDSTHSGKVKEAEFALLSWEQEDPNMYAHHLLSTFFSMEEEYAMAVRLGALLSLKASVVRSWKDRGRGRAGARKMMTSEMKEYVRKCILSIVTNGGADVIIGEGEMKMTEKKWRFVQYLLEDKTLQKSASSLLSKIGRLDLPLSFHELIPTLVQYATTRTLPDRFPKLTEEERKEQLTMTLNYNASDALEMILSELCSKRLLVDKKYIAKISHESVGILVGEGWMMAMSYIGAYITASSTEVQPSSSPQRTLCVIKYALLLSKILSHLFHSALPTLLTEDGSTPSSAIVDQVYTAILEAVPALLRFLEERIGSNDKDVGRNAPVHDKEAIAGDLDTLLDVLGSLVVEVQHAHPLPCSRFVGPFLDMFYSNLMRAVSSQIAVNGQVSEVAPTALTAPECFLMCAMRFLANIVSCSHYMPDEEANEAIAAMRSETISSSGDRRVITSRGDTIIDRVAIQTIVQTVWFDFFTEDRLRQLADVSIKHFMILSAERLDEWEADPESFVITESQRNVDDDLAACAQNLYLSLVESKAGKPIIAPLVVTMLGDIGSQLNAAKIEAGEVTADAGNRNVLLWNSIYTAAGLSVNVLIECEGFEIDTWFEKTLVPCLASILQGRNKVNVLPVLRHRLVWLICCIAHCISDTKTALQVLISIINNEPSSLNDVAVRLGAVEALTSILNVHYDLIDEFYHLLEIIISSLYRLVNDCTEINTRAQSLSCISLLLFHVVASGRKVDYATANAAVQPLPALWEVATDQNILLRRDVLSILSGVGLAVGRTQVGHLYPIVLPMINSSLDPSCQDRDVCLVEDVLALWLNLLRLATSYELHWESLFSRVKDILEQDLEHLKILMLITEGYILLGGASFLNAHYSTLQNILILVVGQTKPRGAAYTALVFEALLRTFPVEGGTLLLQGGIMRTMLSSCALNYQNNSACEPERVIVLYLTAIARSLLGNPALLDETLPITSTSNEGVTLSYGPRELVRFISS
uniref:Importin N-terminal domain-containing protein n=2 Tax=Ditylum brightwellii TaxID=49249 RepID=A0A7S4RP11_9STRA